MKCLNLCEILNRSLFLNDIKELELSKYKRVYFGSYFCSNYFLYMDFMEDLYNMCKENQIKCTLVIPVFGQVHLECGKKKIEEILYLMKTYIDEITVNDVGMFCHMDKTHPELKINLGRLFFKEQRDARIVALNDEIVEPTGIVNIFKSFSAKNIYMCELDEVSDKIHISNFSNIAIHYPFCYATTGFICKYASIHKSIDKKFRPNDTCMHECFGLYEHYSGEIETGNPQYYRIGRTVYFEKKKRSSLNIIPQRTIYFPFKEIVARQIKKSDGIKNENISTFK